MSRASRSLAWVVVAVAAIVIPLGTMLISSVSHIERDVEARVVGLGRLDRVERYALSLCGLVTGEASPNGSQPADMTSMHAQYSGWIEGVLALAPADADYRAAHASVQTAVAKLEDLRTRAVDASAPEAAAAITSVFDGIANLRRPLRADLALMSYVLASRWKQLNFLAILSCALAITLALVLFAYDRSVLERKKVESEEQTLRAELAHVGRLSVVGEMGTKVAHELNQPLGAIHSYLAGCVRRLQQKEGDPAEMIRALQAAAEEAKRASSIIRGLRDFARNAQPSASPVEINDLVREVLPLLSAELRESHVEPELDLSEGLETILVDRIQIGQVIVNLVRNALEAMSGTPAVERRLILRTARATDQGSGRGAEPAILVSVEDTGSGVAPELLPNLFQPFHTTKPKGMGMGLAISRTIVEAHEGWIRAEPRPGQGTVFRFRIPCPVLVTA